MICKLIKGLFPVAAAALVTMSALAEAAEPPPMTAEQKVEMEAYMKAGTPGAPHQMLASTAGSYDLKLTSWHEPGGPAMVESGTATRTMMLDGRVLVEEVSSKMMGMPFTGHGMTGHDNVTGKMWSTWNDTMITGIIVSEGTCDWQKNRCSLTGSMNDPVKKTPMKMRFTSKWPTATTEVFEMFAPGKDGKEMKMMEITYSKN